ncbi:MAG TPA: Calx-beta domain-containing protein [Pyrinomonadaceae bacterium]|nr:Calx-beta domain-containing protein [Pyrinomonadaceae bacterium]
MNNFYLRRRLSLLLLVVIVVSPLSFASRTSRANAPIYSPFDEPTEFIRQIPLTTNDLVYSSLTGKIYVTVPSSVGSGGNSIKTLDPTTGVFESSTFIGSEPNKLALSDDGHNLYVSLDGSAAVRRFDVQTNTPGLQFTVGQDSFNGRYFVGEFAVAPGNPDLLAVARSTSSLGPSGNGVAVFDNGLRRTNVASGSDFIAFSASASKLYGTAASFGGLQTMNVDASGVTVGSTSSLVGGARIKFSNGLIFSSSGQVVNPDTNTLLGTFSNVNTPAFVPDTANGRAYYLTFDQFGGGNFILKAFDINTFLLLGSLNISGATGTPTSLLRWGPNGLAFRTSNNQLFIIQTSLIPSAEPIPTPTPIVSPTPTPSPTPVAGFVRQMTVGTNDLVYNQGTQKLYASVPSSEGSSGNSLAEIDPAMAAITSQVFVGSEPTQLAAADDGSTLYVGLDGAASIRSYNILTHTPGTQFSVGRDNFTGPYSFSDLAVSPGNPSVIAVARQNRFNSPSQAGVAVFDNGVQRAKTGPGHIDGADFLAFGSSSVLYGNSFQGVTTMTIDNTGVTVTGTTRFTVGNSLIFDNNRLYGSTGQVLNPATGELVGSFSVGGFASAHAIDSANGRAFFLLGGGPTFQIKAFDLNTFLPVGFVNVSGVTGTPGSLVRWGTNGVAFRTNTRQVFLIETALVNASIPVASPTPTPSPTPSPSPSVIPTFIRRINLPANDLVYSEATHNLYASIPSSASSNGNSILKINPQTGELGPSTFIGSEPNKIAISSDNQTLWVHLDGANAARRFDVVTQTSGLQFSTGAPRVLDMKVVPGSPESVALTTFLFNSGVAIYDSGVKRANTGPSFPPVGPIEFGATPSILYGFNSASSGLDFVKYLVDPSGVTQSSVTGGLLTGNSMKFSNGLMYSGGGRVADPENSTLVGTFVGAGFAQAMAVDAALHRVFYLTADGTNVVLRAFDSDTFLPVGSVTLPLVGNSPVNLVRWGTNGLAFNTQSSGFFEAGQIYILQSELVSNAEPVPAGVGFNADRVFASEGSSTQTVRVSRTGDVSGSISVNFATSDGTATAGSDYTATSGTLNFGPGELSKDISIPILSDLLFENGNETFNVNLSSPTGGAVIATSSTTVIIQDDDPKPVVIVGGSVITEGDSGTKNLAVNFLLDHPSVQVITVDFATSNGTATAGNDYVAASGTVTFPAGTTSVPVNITINGDTTVEPDETFTISLSNATNANAIIFMNPIVRITNDDATLQLSNTSFSVNESAGEATVTVTRIGDISRAATVQFATTDTAGLQSCTVANGKASERCDYGTAIGTVRFAIGETIKTFTMPIVNDALVEGAETFTVNLVGPTGATLGTTTLATITIVDDDLSPATQNPIDGVNFFVTQQYIDFLGRLPDSIGFANWTDTLGKCPDGGFGEFANPDCDRVHVSAGFFLSEEFRGRGYFAYKFYEVGFDRRPTYAEFMPDMVQVGGPQSPASEALSKAAYTDAFAQRQEFKNRYDALSNSAYVDALEANAEVALANKAALVDALNTSQKTRAQVLREVVELQSVTDKFFIRAFVAMQYFGYLRRDPDTIGYDNWITTLTADPSDFRHMIFGFLFSDEYRHRFGP